MAQMLHGGADLLQGYPGVEQPLDDLQHEDVAETVQALGAGPVGRPDTRLHESRARPVVELTVGDPGGRARGGPTVTGVLWIGVAPVLDPPPFLALLPAPAPDP